MESGLRRTVEIEGSEFSFELCCRRRTKAGPVELDQWWMPVTPLYAQNTRGVELPHNHREILRYYWRKAETTRSTVSRDAQERFVLASILPMVRVRGSRNIFADAFLQRPQIESVRELESLIRGSRGESITRAEFFHQTRELLGRTQFPAQIEDVYDQMSQTLLRSSCEVLATGDVRSALDAAEGTWNQFQQRIGRRAGHAEQKLVLDVLSYEARAAFHDCYSIVWCDLLEDFVKTEGWGFENAMFHRFWHTAQRDSGHGTPFFHGHVFGLHPASGPFMLSESGNNMLGRWLANPENAECFGELLHGLLIGIFHYEDRRSQQAAGRSRRETTVGDASEFEDGDSGQDDEIDA